MKDEQHDLFRQNCQHQVKPLPRTFGSAPVGRHMKPAPSDTLF